MSIFARIAIAAAILLAAMLALAGCASSPARNPAFPRGDLAELIVAEIAVARNELPLAARHYADLAMRSTQPEVLERAARLASDAQQPRLALKSAKRWMARSPDAIAAHELAASAALQLYQINAAATHLRRVLTLEPGGLERGLQRISALLSASDDVYAARKLAAVIAADHADSPAAQQFLGMAEANADDSSAAALSLSRAWRSRPTAELGWSLARALAIAGQEHAALELANAQVDRNGDAAGRLEHAMVLMLLRRFAAAQAELETILEEPQGGDEALRLLGRLKLQRGDLDVAEECFSRLIKRDHYVSDAFFYLGVIAERRTQDAAALRLYARVEDGGNVLAAMLRAAALLRRGGATDQAEQLLDSLLADVPLRTPQILAARAQLYADGNELQRGLELLNAAISTYPDNPELRFTRADLLDRSQQLQPALRELSELQRRRPDDPAALNALGYTLADHSLQLARARRLIESAYSQAPQSAAIRDSLGWVLFRSGKPRDALPHLTAAFAADGGAETGAHLGEVLWALDRRDEALRIWKQAGAENPRDRVLLATIARLRGSN